MQTRNLQKRWSWYRVVCVLIAIGVGAYGLWGWYDRTKAGTPSEGKLRVEQRPWVSFTAGFAQGPLEYSGASVVLQADDENLSQVVLDRPGISEVKFRFEDDHPPKTVYFFADLMAPQQDTMHNLVVNGQTIVEERLTGQSGVHRDFDAYGWDITKAVHPGHNEVTMTLSSTTSAPLWVRGAFVAPNNSLSELRHALPDPTLGFYYQAGGICLLFGLVLLTYLILERTLWRSTELPVADSIVYSVTCFVLATVLSYLWLPNALPLCIFALVVALGGGFYAFLISRRVRRQGGVRS